MPRRVDLLGECNGNAAPLDVFTRECCANCFNPECTRSLSGTLKFDQRVTHWYEKLFANPNRMAQEDPRYAKIAGQRFLTLDTSRIPEVSTSAWVDPRDLTEGAAPTPKPSAFQKLVTEVEKDGPLEATVLATRIPPKEAPVVSETPPVKRPVPSRLLLSNTPTKGGIMLKAPEATTPPKDAWAAPTPAPASTIPVVQPGTKVKLGGSGV